MPSAERKLGKRIQGIRDRLDNVRKASPKNGGKAATPSVEQFGFNAADMSSNGHQVAQSES